MSNDKLFLTFCDISRLIPVGEKTLRNKSCQGTLPFPSCLMMGKRVVRRADFDRYLDSFSPAPVSTAIPTITDTFTPKKRGRGRPTNASRAAAAAEAKIEVRHA